MDFSDFRFLMNGILNAKGYNKKAIAVQTQSINI